MNERTNLEFIVRAKDEASRVFKSIGDNGVASAKALVVNYKAVSAALLATGAAIEGLARSEQERTNRLRGMAVQTDMTVAETRRFTLALTDHANSINDVIAAQERLISSGIRTRAEMGIIISAAGTLSTAIGTDMAGAIDIADRALSALGLPLTDLEQHMDTITFLARQTTVGVQELGMVFRREQQNIRATGLSLDDVAVAMAALEDAGIRGPRAVMGFQSALQGANGDIDKFWQGLGLSNAELDAQRERLSDAEGLTRELAEAYAGTETWLQRFQGVMSDAKFATADWLTSASQIAPALIGIGMVMPIVINAYRALQAALIATNIAFMASPVGIILVGAALVAGLVFWRNYRNEMNETTRQLELMSEAAREAAKTTMDDLPAIEANIVALRDQKAALEANVEALDRQRQARGRSYQQQLEDAKAYEDAKVALRDVTEQLTIQEAVVDQVTERQEMLAAAMADVADETALASEEIRILHPRMVAAAAAAKIMADESLFGIGKMFILAQAIRDTQAAMEQSIELEQWTNLILAASGYTSDWEERLNGLRGALGGAAIGSRDAGAAAADLNSQQLAAALAAELLARGATDVASAMRMAERAAVDEIRALRSSEELLHEITNALLGIDAAGGSAAQRMREVAAEVERALSAARQNAISALDQLGNFLTTALRRQYEAASAGRMAVLEAERIAMDAAHNRRIQQLNDEHERTMRSLRERADARLAPLLEELRLMDEQQLADELGEIERQLKIAWDPNEVLRLQKQRDDILKRERRKELEGQMRDIEQELREEELRQRESLNRRVEDERAAHARRTAALQQAAAAEREILRQQTEAWRLEADARELITKGSMDDIVALLESYFPEWHSAGLSLGQQLIDGLRQANIAGFIKSQLAAAGAAAAASGGMAMPAGEGVTGQTPAQLAAQGQEMAAYTQWLANMKAQGVPEFVLAQSRKTFEDKFGAPAPLAEGGVITSPTFALLGERASARPEIVAPERKMRQVFEEVLASSGQRTIELHNYTVLDGEVVDHRVEHVLADQTGPQAFGYGTTRRRRMA